MSHSVLFVGALSFELRFNHETLTGKAVGLWHIKFTKYHECRYCARTTSRLCESQIQRFQITQAVSLLPVYPLPVVDSASSKTNPSITILHTSRRPGEQKRSNLTYVHIANGNTTHFCGLEGSEEGVGEKVGWRKSRWARVEVTKFKRHTNWPRWVCVVVTSVCRGFA